MKNKKQIQKHEKFILGIKDFYGVETIEGKVSSYHCIPPVRNAKALQEMSVDGSYCYKEENNETRKGVVTEINFSRYPYDNIFMTLSPREFYILGKPTDFKITASYICSPSILMGDRK